MLPLTFTSIHANEINKQVDVAREIAQVLTLIKYVVERSANGLHFIKVGEVPTTGNNTATANYTWLGNSPLAGNIYYRIRSVESDGKYYYSPLVVVKIMALTLQIYIYPNPMISNTIHLQISNLEKGKLQRTTI